MKYIHLDEFVNESDIQRAIDESEKCIIVNIHNPNMKNTLNYIIEEARVKRVFVCLRNLSFQKPAASDPSYLSKEPSLV